MISTNTLSKGGWTPNGGVARSGQGVAAAADAGAWRMPLAQFVWGVGIECSFIPHLNVDQFKWTQHDRFWKEDLKRAREELGVTHLRYAMP
jgi:hypothetical protein